MKVYIVHADTCLSDYWSGHHRPHVCVPMFDGITYAEIRDAIREEIRQGAVMGSDDDAQLLSSDFVQDEKRADLLTRKVYAAINRDVRGAQKGWRVAWRGEDSDDLYAFFVIMVEE